MEIFIVDDDHFCRRLYQQCFLNIGYSKIHLFDNGPDCLRNIAALQPQIILINYNMQPYNGMQLMKKIKLLYPDIFLLLVSANTDKQLAIEALRWGAFDFIIKDGNELEAFKKIINSIPAMTSGLKKVGD